eukprot:TCALIF_04564-PA protein Name:"Protein of unknown function" AED:0.61 eAED:0.61 QI:0/0/0/0.33/1/1/3/0/160
MVDLSRSLSISHFSISDWVSLVEESRDTLVDRYNRATYATRLLEETYQISISNLVTLHNNYMRSKEVKNLFNRYTLLRDMIKDAVKLESSWWAVAELPKQNRAESIQDYVLRVCSVLETLRMPFDASGGFQESEKEKEARLEKVNGKNKERNIMFPSRSQ